MNRITKFWNREYWKNMDRYIREIRKSGRIQCMTCDKPIERYKLKACEDTTIEITVWCHGQRHHEFLLSSEFIYRSMIVRGFKVFRFAPEMDAQLDKIFFPPESYLNQLIECPTHSGTFYKKRDYCGPCFGEGCRSTPTFSDAARACGY